MKRAAALRAATIPAAGLLATGLLLAACGTNSSNSSGGSGAAPAVRTASVPGVGIVLVDSAGNTLYFTDQDANGGVMCTGSCTGIWHPALSSGNSPPTGSVSGIGLFQRPDNGQKQLTYQGKPLYEFALDGGGGKATGNGAHDQFDGKSFTWHAVVVAGGGVAPTAPTTGGGGGGGYGYNY